MSEPAQVFGELVDLSDGAAIGVELMADDAGELMLTLWKARRIEGAYQPSGPVVSIPLGDVEAVFHAVARIHDAGERAEEAGELRLDPAQK